MCLGAMCEFIWIKALNRLLAQHAEVALKVTTLSVFMTFTSRVIESTPVQMISLLQQVVLLLNCPKEVQRHIHAVREAFI
jgi:hypothetical protein